MTCKKPQTKLAVEFNGKAHKLLSVPGDFFTNLGTAMPGDVLTDTITVSNTTDSTAEILFRTSTEGQERREQLAMLKDVKLIVAMGNETIYQRDSGFDSTCREQITWNFGVRTEQEA